MASRAETADVFTTTPLGYQNIYLVSIELGKSMSLVTDLVLKIKEKK